MRVVALVCLVAVMVFCCLPVNATPAPVTARSARSQTVLSFAVKPTPAAVLAAAMQRMGHGKRIVSLAARETTNKQTFLGTGRPIKVGIYLVSLSDFDPARRTFNADFWIWMLSAEPNFKVLQNLDFINGIGVETTGAQTVRRGKQWWSTCKVRGQWRYDWDIYNYPFDRHAPSIIIESRTENSDSAVFVADARNSGMKVEAPTEWKLETLQVESSAEPYDTNFGDPTAKNHRSVYPRFTASIEVRRSGLSSFWRLNAAPYIAFILSLLSFLVRVDNASLFSGRMSLNVGGLFAAVISLRTIDGTLGHYNGLSLPDSIHLLAMIFILASSAVAIFSRRLTENRRLDPTHRLDLSQRLDHRAFLVSLIAFTFCNLYLIFHDLGNV